MPFHHLKKNPYYYEDVEFEVTDVNGQIANLQLKTNREKFALQIHSLRASLQYFPVQVYHIGGALVWEGKIQSNRLETLDLGNMESGVYVLQVILEEEVLVERFLVE